MSEIRVLLVDNKEIFREGLARLIDEREQMRVVDQCFNIEQVIKKVKETEPDVVLIDNDISGRDTGEATREIKESAPQVKVAVLSGTENENELFSAMKSGATGYLLKDMKVDDLIKSIELVGKGDVVISTPLAGKLVGKFTYMLQKEARDEHGLTDRELEIVALLVKGATNKEIAQALPITENTTKVHIKNILQKLELRNRQQIVSYAFQHNLATNTGTDIPASNTD